MSAPHAKRPAWVVAQWKHAVPEAGAHHGSDSDGDGSDGDGILRGPRGRALRRARAERLVQDAQCSEAYRAARGLVAAVLKRCARVQRDCALPLPAATDRARPRQRPGSAGTLGGNRPPRSLRFEAPPPPLTAGAAGDGLLSSPPPVAAPITQLQPQQQQPPLHAPPVDLNPGFSFAPGSPQRVAAVIGTQQPQLLETLAALEALRRDVRRLDLARLPHRDALRAGVAALSSELYSALGDARSARGGAGGGWAAAAAAAV